MMADAHEANLKHVLEDTCTDPDCELHNPEVGVQEGTVDKTGLALFIAGYIAGAGAAADKALDVKADLIDELTMEGVIPHAKEG